MLYTQYGESIGPNFKFMLDLELGQLAKDHLRELRMYPFLSNTYLCTFDKPEQGVYCLIPLALFFMKSAVTKSILEDKKLNGQEITGLNDVNWRRMKRWVAANLPECKLKDKDPLSLIATACEHRKSHDRNNPLYVLANEYAVSAIQYTLSEASLGTKYRPLVIRRPGQNKMVSVPLARLGTYPRVSNGVMVHTTKKDVDIQTAAYAITKSPADLFTDDSPFMYYESHGGIVLMPRNVRPSQLDDIFTWMRLPTMSQYNWVNFALALAEGHLGTDFSINF